MGFLKQMFNSLKQDNKNQNSDPLPDLHNRYSWLDQRYTSASDKYFSGMEKIEADWSILYNLNCFTGSKADKFIEDCKQNISDFFSWQKIAQKYNETAPPSVPAFKRLAMIYEKQELYENAISVCKEAILSFASADGTKGGMKGRLARMIKKSGRQPTQEELILLDL